MKFLCKRQPEYMLRVFGRLKSDAYKGGSHNTLISMFLQGGVVGLVLGLPLYFYAFYILFFVSTKSENLLYVAVAFVFFAIVLNSLTEVMLFSKRGMLLLSLLAYCGNVEESIKSSGCVP